MKKGFSLLEILIVLAIGGIILLSIHIRASSSLLERTKVANTTEELRQLKKAIMGDPNVGTKGYYGDVGKLPESLSDLVNKPPTVPNWDRFIERGWNGPYIQNSDYDKDAWGNQYVYDSQNGKITSRGPDGTLGTSDDIVIFLFQ